MTSRKISIVVAVLFGVCLNFCFVVDSAEAQSKQSGFATLPIRAEDPKEKSEKTVVRGQEKKSPGLFERMKRSFANLTKDTDEEMTDDEPVGSATRNPTRANQNTTQNPSSSVSSNTPSSNTSTATNSAVPAKPPKPVTAQEVRKSVEDAEKAPEPVSQPAKQRQTQAQTQTRQSTTPAERSQSATRQRRQAVEEAEVEEFEEEEYAAEETEDIFTRLSTIRHQVFDKQTVDGKIVQQEMAADDYRIPVRNTSSSQAVSNRRTPPPQSNTLYEQEISYGETSGSASKSGMRTSEAIPLNSRQNQSQGTRQEMNYVDRSIADQFRQSGKHDTDAAGPDITYGADVRGARQSNAYQQPLAGIDVNVRAQNTGNNMRNYPTPQSEPRRIQSAQPREYRIMNSTGTASVRSEGDQYSNQNSDPYQEGSRGEYQVASRRLLNNPERQSDGQLMAHSSSYQSLQQLPQQNSVQDSQLDSQQGPQYLTAPPHTVNQNKVFGHSHDGSGMPRPADRMKNLMVSPCLEVETEGDARSIVGQESIYRIKVFNRGNGAAEQVVLSTEIPPWIDILQPEISVGTTSILPTEKPDNTRDFIWKISRIEPNGEAQLVLHLVPQERKSMDLRVRYDFFKPSAVAKLIAQEAILEMELEGPDEVLWGSKIGYKLFVRNTGNGDAEDVKLELLQTGVDAKSCDLPVLKPGEEQVIDVDVWTGKQDAIDINIVASGLHGVTQKVARKVTVLRPNVVMTVESPASQFVGNQAEFLIKIRNAGTAPAKNVVLEAAIPLGTQYISCSGGGKLAPKNKVVWDIEMIPVGDAFIASVLCEPKREGMCKLDTLIRDKSGVLGQCSGGVNAVAIVELKLDVDYPQGPVEIGDEAVYTINVSNRGSKAAEGVEVIAAFARGVEPYAIEGENAYMNDGQVVFDKIASIAAGQTVMLKVKSRADRAGNHRVRTDVICSNINVHLVNEHTTYFYKKQKDKARAIASGDQTKYEVLRSSDAATPTDETQESQPMVGTSTRDPFLN